MSRRPLKLAILLALTAALDAPAAELYAVLVGVQDYEHESLRTPPLKYAVRDVTEFGKVLEGYGYEVTLLTDDTGRTDRTLRPTKANIDAALFRVLRGEVQRDDTVLVAFSGHGLQFAGSPDAYFCPIDAVPFADETETLVSVSGAYAQFERSFAGVKVILVDACRNDPDPSRGRGVDGDTAPLPPRGVAALFSCSRGQRAFENDTLRHGVFFHSVLEGMRGAAAEEDGALTFEGLALHVRRRDPGEVRRLVGDVAQVPNLKADLEGVPVLAILRVPPRTTPRPRPAAPTPPDNQPTAAGEERSDNALSMPLVWCPPTGPGGFLMGSPDSEEDARDNEKPQHRVVLTKGFWLGRHEVTQAELEMLMGTRPWEGKDIVLDSPRAPATYVSWEDAVAFCERLTENERRTGRLPADERYELPSEAQWEYACRAGTTTRWSFGDEESRLGDYAWWGGFLEEGNVKDQPYAHDVETRRANGWGLFDLHGNVMEWCADWYAYEFYETDGRTDPSGPRDGERRVLRGGGWYGIPVFTRSAGRFDDTPDRRNGDVGFRVARTK